mmetsp:Transcript_14355/g.31343  ORF Transcript_14355/g.31343 Transcript_14355/m.31343 type:complete len:233 (+) Transcript_14355:1256-1954(+)
MVIKHMSILSNAFHSVLPRSVEARQTLCQNFWLQQLFQFGICPCANQGPNDTTRTSPRHNMRKDTLSCQTTNDPQMIKPHHGSTTETKRSAPIGRPSPFEEFKYLVTMDRREPLIEIVWIAVVVSSDITQVRVLTIPCASRSCCPIIFGSFQVFPVDSATLINPHQGLPKLVLFSFEFGLHILFVDFLFRLIDTVHHWHRKCLVCDPVQCFDNLMHKFLDNFLWFSRVGVAE